MFLALKPLRKGYLQVGLTTLDSFGDSLTDVGEYLIGECFFGLISFFGVALVGVCFAGVKLVGDLTVYPTDFGVNAIGLARVGV